VAGTLQGLLTLAEEGGGGDAVERAGWCAEHLLRMRREDPESGLRAWATSSPVPETGFAHGSSGIAHALLELYRRTEDARLYEAAMEAFAFERSVYREDLREWPDRRDQPADRPLMSSWCHGAPGVGLSRLAALDVVRPDDEPGVASDLLLALKKTSAAGVHGMNNLCCGTFGRVDVLLEAGRRLENPTLERQARRMADECLERTEGLGFVLPDYAEEEPHLRAGLWQGLAGVGYALLRLADPERYPCILRMA
ncbi:MAG: type 2 lantipeptide synthetase LanM, partial [Gemmatimonadetes bacterium]|nr:type 2 lantipeptide synthetase LanM [Gemmatimonadota bacterium]